MALVERADILRDVIDEHARDHNRWAGQEIADDIGHCLIYVSWDAALIRPLIPPTSEHAAFADAEQRIYMSATLGAGGELERAFGVTKIERLPVPDGWDEHGSGRRFFLFPGAVQDADNVDACIAGAIHRADKALVLAPSRRELGAFAATAVAGDDADDPQWRRRARPGDIHGGAARSGPAGEPLRRDRSARRQLPPGRPHRPAGRNSPAGALFARHPRRAACARRANPHPHRPGRRALHA
jgi:hypothetical protein